MTKLIIFQVWFQNTRARERKGQFRAHQQVINKRCPFCPAIFRVRSALESHLATKHADHYTRGEIDIDALPDAEGFPEGAPALAAAAAAAAAAVSAVPVANDRPASMPSANQMPPLPLPPLVPTTSDQLHSMQKYYEDTMKRYMNDLQASNNAANSNNGNNETAPGGPPVGGGGGLPESNVRTLFL